MTGNEGILFGTIINTADVTVLLELVLYHSSIDFNPIVLFLWKALRAYKASPIIKSFEKWCSSLYKCTGSIYISQYCFLIIIYICAIKAIVFSIATVWPKCQAVWISCTFTHFICEKKHIFTWLRESGGWQANCVLAYELSLLIMLNFFCSSLKVTNAGFFF